MEEKYVVKDLVRDIHEALGDLVFGSKSLDQEVQDYTVIDCAKLSEKDLTLLHADRTRSDLVGDVVELWYMNNESQLHISVDLHNSIFGVYATIEYDTKCFIGDEETCREMGTIGFLLGKGGAQIYADSRHYAGEHLEEPRFLKSLTEGLKPEDDSTVNPGDKYSREVANPQEGEDTMKDLDIFLGRTSPNYGRQFNDPKQVLKNIIDAAREAITKYGLPPVQPSDF